MVCEFYFLKNQLQGEGSSAQLDRVWLEDNLTDSQQSGVFIRLN